MVSTSYTQNIEYYVPAGFINPLLKSGQLITSLFYFGDQITTKQDMDKTKFSSKDINFLGYLGITDKLTLKTRLVLSPPQTIEEFVEGGTGGNKNKFSISPELSLSYRPKINFEIFSSIYYSNKTTQIGERGYYVEMPVVDPNTGNIIYQRVLVTAPARPDLNTTNTTVILGFSYIGKLW
jgi:hypothetical protein